MRLFNKVVDIIIKMMVPLIVLTLMIGIARIYFDLWGVFKTPSISQGFDMMITNILTMFVVIELLRSIMEYFEIHRLKITFVTDASLVFILREVMIELYQHKLGWAETASLGFLSLVIGILRTLAIKYSPDGPDNIVVKEAHEQGSN